MRYLLVYLPCLVLWMYAVNMNITQYFYTETKIIKKCFLFQSLLTFGRLFYILDTVRITCYKFTVRKIPAEFMVYLQMLLLLHF